MSNGKCHDECSGYAFAIVQYKSCWCSNYAPGDTTSTGSCNVNCPGYPYEQCGDQSAGLYGYIALGPSPQGTQGGAASSAPSPSASPSQGSNSNNQQQAVSGQTSPLRGIATSVLGVGGTFPGSPGPLRPSKSTLSPWTNTATSIDAADLTTTSQYSQPSPVQITVQNTVTNTPQVETQVVSVVCVRSCAVARSKLGRGLRWRYNNSHKLIFFLSDSLGGNIHSQPIYSCLNHLDPRNHIHAYTHAHPNINATNDALHHVTLSDLDTNSCSLNHDCHRQSSNTYRDTDGAARSRANSDCSKGQRWRFLLRFRQSRRHLCRSRGNCTRGTRRSRILLVEEAEAKPATRGLTVHGRLWHTATKAKQAQSNGLAGWIIAREEAATNHSNEWMGPRNERREKSRGYTQQER